MQNFNKIYKPFLYSALIIAPVLAIVRIVLMNAFYKTELQNYTTQTQLPTVFSALLIICCILLFCAFFFIKPTQAQEKIPKSTIPSLFISSLCGFFFISSVFLILYFNPEILTVEGMARIITSQSKVTFWCIILSLIFSIPSAAFFLMAELPTHCNKTYVKILSFAPILWCIAYLIYIYFDSSVVLNNSEKISCQLSMIFAMLYLTSECRYRVDMPRPRLHLALSLVSIVVIAAYSIPNIVLNAMLVLPFNMNSIYSGIQFVILLYIIVRTFQFTKAEEAIPVSSAQ